MKFKLIVKITEKIIGKSTPEGEPRADMYLPDFLLAFSLVLVIAGIGLGISYAFFFNPWLIAAGSGAFLLGITAFMCWKNQTIRIISSGMFEYTTFLGRSYTYYFKDITALKQNNDSLTLYIGDRKVHIESMAVLSDKLVDLINQALEENTGR